MCNHLKCLLLLDMQLKEGRVQMFVASRYATEKWPGSNLWGLVLLNEAPFI